MNNILTLNNSVSLRVLDIKAKLSLRAWLILSFSLIVFLLSFYVFQVNALTQAGFSIANHEKQIAEFSQESQLLSDSVTNLSSLAKLETVLSEMEYEAVGQIHYLRVPGTTALAK